MASSSIDDTTTMRYPKDINISFEQIKFTTKKGLFNRRKLMRNVQSFNDTLFMQSTSQEV
jgi:hypothetical protein